MEISMYGRAAIITGGSKGIGFAIATRFSSSGADVAIVSRGREALDAAVAAKTTRRERPRDRRAGRCRYRGRRAARL